MPRQRDLRRLQPLFAASQVGPCEQAIPLSLHHRRLQQSLELASRKPADHNVMQQYVWHLKFLNLYKRVLEHKGYAAAAGEGQWIEMARAVKEAESYALEKLEPEVLKHLSPATRSACEGDDSVEYEDEGDEWPYPMGRCAKCCTVAQLATIVLAILGLTVSLIVGAAEVAAFTCPDNSTNLPTVLGQPKPSYLPTAAVTSAPEAQEQCPLPVVAVFLLVGGLTLPLACMGCCITRHMHQCCRPAKPTDSHADAVSLSEQLCVYYAEGLHADHTAVGPLSVAEVAEMVVRRELKKSARLWRASADGAWDIGGNTSTASGKNGNDPSQFNTDGGGTTGDGSGLLTSLIVVI